MTSNDTGTCEWLAMEIALNRLIERSDLDPVVTTFQAENPYADATALAEHLVKLGLLTPFQATRLLEGQSRGLVLGPYVITELLGSGSMGTVYKALGRADFKPYAIKVLPARGPWNVRQARKKLQQFPQGGHPGVVQWLDVGTSAGLHYLVWPFAEGESLEAVVTRDGLLPPAQAALIGVQIAHALQWCEQNDVWHGAIKPSNIMIGPEGQVKLLDLGVGVLLAEVEEESVVDTMAESGSLAAQVDCTAPECIIDPATRSIRGDQYSLGCVLYYGLTGRYPFPDGTTSERMLAHQRQEPTPVTVLNPGVPNALAMAIERLMQKGPEARYNHTDELISALTPLARQSSVYVPPSSTPPFLQPRDPKLTPVRPTPSLLTVGSARLSTPPPGFAPARTPRPSIPPTPAARNSAALPAAPTSDLRAVALTRLAPDALPAPPPPRRSLWERLKRKLIFWKSYTDPVAVTLLTPSGLLPGETATVQVVLHHADRSAQAKSLPDWRGTVAMPEPLERGEGIGLQLRMPGVETLKPLATIEWNGYSAAALLTVRLPAEWPGNQAAKGILTVGRDQRPIGKIEFTIPVPARHAAR
jgi:serine/threonine protein kinase